VSDLAGRVLAGRYLLHSAIGTGASGRVYLAEDTRLRRRVAVKILHAALAEDTAFLRRFRAEAQVAASLHHPHIVTVHDWGEDDVPFMVLELLEGGSLRSILDQETHLSVPQAARVGRDVASALDYAHARGILHRDIKPANLLFDEHGIVRVADFGLARALAEASWTEPSGAVFGTARYASPEQAMGVQLDARSDLYSLSLVLIEAVTGKVPFAADTTIGMLTARTQRVVTAPPELGPLAPVVERAGRIDVSERYPDAATMRAAINDVGESLPPPGPLALAGMVDQPDPHPTRTVAPEPTGALFDQDASDAVPAVQPVARHREVRRLVPLVVIAAVMVAIVLGAVAFAQISGGSQAEVPGVVGYPLDQARAQVDKAGFGVTVAHKNAPDPAGTVIAQTPESGTFSTADRVRLTVSDGPAPVKIPAVNGAKRDDAAAALAAAGFTVGPDVGEFSDKVDRGMVIAAEPAQGQAVPPDSQVTLHVSKGRAPVNVPDVRGQAFDAAQATLSGLGFQVTRGDDGFSDTIPAGQVMTMSATPGQPADYGSTIQLVVSKGPDLVDVPNVVRQLLGPALAQLQALGFQVAVNGPLQYNKPVTAQSVTGPAPRGSAITLTPG
jgi:beta-lactam-binding protein with PASTA domain/tRNA A-37 threonylcarbamoyl transferase component Bud32